jgi:hypothetical protein
VIPDVLVLSLAALPVIDAQTVQIERLAAGPRTPVMQLVLPGVIQLGLLLQEPTLRPRTLLDPGGLLKQIVQLLRVAARPDFEEINMPADPGNRSFRSQKLLRPVPSGSVHPYSDNCRQGKNDPEHDQPQAASTHHGSLRTFVEDANRTIQG